MSAAFAADAKAATDAKVDIAKKTFFILNSTKFRASGGQLSPYPAAVK
jgi:hypothetical protein